MGRASEAYQWLTQQVPGWCNGGFFALPRLRTKGSYRVPITESLTKCLARDYGNVATYSGWPPTTIALTTETSLANQSLFDITIMTRSTLKSTIARVVQNDIV